ncbi:hypothetical protein GHV40_08865 [Devosia sp. D6-9]|nr:hypothetical protein GHV40_08865 [Devosia sp. D6-9]
MTTAIDVVTVKIDSKFGEQQIKPSRTFWLYLAATLLTTGLLCAALFAEHYLTTNAAISVPTTTTPGIGMALVASPRNQDKTSLLIAPGENSLGYVKRVTDFIHLSTYHCDPGAPPLSLFEQLVFIGRAERVVNSEGILVRSRFTCGYCHQRAYLAARLLRHSGIEAVVYGLNGHVLLRFHIDGADYFTDPDYGVGPYAYSDDPQFLHRVVLNNYAKASWLNAETIAGMATSYEDNAPYGEYLDIIYEEQRAGFRLARILANLNMALAIVAFGTALTIAYRLRRSATSSQTQLVAQ